MSQKSDEEKAQTIAFRLAADYAKIVARAARAAGVKPNQYARIVTIAVAQNRLLDLSARTARIEDGVIRIRKELGELIVDE